MNNNKDDRNFVEMFRDKTEIADLDNILKSSFGGYTKKSVQEYISVVRKQLQSSNDTFQKNIQSLFEEKENIRKSNEALLARYNKLSAEYDNLSESIKDIKLENKEFSVNDIYSLKSKVLSLQEEEKILYGEKKSLEKKIDQLNKTVEDLKNSLNISHNETEAQKEMLRAEKLETKKQRDMVADLSRQLSDEKNELKFLKSNIEDLKNSLKLSKDETEAQKEMLKIEKQEARNQRDMVADLTSQLNEEKNEVKFLKSTMSEGKFYELNSKINELNVQLSAQTDVIYKLNSENALKDKTNETLNNEIISLKQRLNSFIQDLQNSNIRNDKLLVANDLLKTQLEEEYKRSINLINEKANYAVDKLIAQKNLDIAESKLISLELQHNNKAYSDEMKKICVTAEDSI